MIRILSFISVSCVLIGAVVFFGDQLPRTDPFSEAEEGEPVFKQICSSTTLCRLKLRHALSSPRYDIGLFGNSRSIDVNSEHVNIGPRSFFNFSIPGESLRHVVGFLEELERGNKAPRVAIISVDHSELQYYGNSSGLQPMIRLRKALKDLRAGLTSERIASKSALRMLWRHVFNETHLFKRNFELAFILNGFFDFFGLPAFPWVNSREDNYGYRADGSRYAPSPPDLPGKIPLLPVQPPSVILDYFVYDLERLKAIDDMGVRIVLYESPLEPRSSDHYRTSPTFHGRRTREIFLETCDRLGLCCAEAPERLPPSLESWHNADHAPASGLGTYIRLLLEKCELEVRHDI